MQSSMGRAKGKIPLLMWTVCNVKLEPLCLQRAQSSLPQHSGAGRDGEQAETWLEVGWDEYLDVALEKM